MNITVNSNQLISVIAPVYNEEKVIGDFVQRLHQVAQQYAMQHQFEFILVDDGSADSTLKVMKNLLTMYPALKIIELRSNYGQTAALQAGIDMARGDIIVTMDADLQHFPEEIPLFLEKIAAGADVVCGWRHKRREGIIRRWPSKVANSLIRKASGLKINDIGTTFRAYRTEILRDITLLGENHRFIPVFAKKAGARIEEIKIENIERPTGKSNYGISRTMDVFLDLFFIHFYSKYFDRPIRIFGKIAFTFIGMGLLIAFILLLKSAVTGIAVVRAHSGWVELSTLLLITGTQFLMTGILAEVLARIYYNPSPSNKTSYKIRHVWDKTTT